MYVFTDVDTYLHSIAYTEAYTSLPLEEREKLVFTAHEMLITYISEELITNKIVAMQTMCIVKGEDSADETAVINSLKSKGVKSYSLEDVSISFADKKQAGYMTWWDNYPGICSDILILLAKTLNPGAKVGSLI